MPSIAFTPRSTPPSLLPKAPKKSPNLHTKSNIQAWARMNQAATYNAQVRAYLKNNFGITCKALKKSPNLHTKSNKKIIQAWAKKNPAATYTEIRAYLKNTFGITYGDKEIQNCREEWGFPLKAPIRALTDHEARELKAWAETNPNATWKKIQAYIKKTFDIEYSERSIGRYKAKWGFPVKAQKEQASALEENHLNKLKAWANKHPNATNTEIQTYIKETFNFEYSERSIRRHKKNWGFTVKTQARSLTNDEVNTLKDWAKGHLHATWEEIQAYMRDTFRVEYTKTSIQEHKKAWGFHVKAQAQKASDNNTLATDNRTPADLYPDNIDEFLSPFLLLENENENGDCNTDRPHSPVPGYNDFDEGFNTHRPLSSFFLPTV